jgi:hypothetical protein
MSTAQGAIYSVAIECKMGDLTLVTPSDSLDPSDSLIVLIVTRKGRQLMKQR